MLIGRCYQVAKAESVRAWSDEVYGSLASRLNLEALRIHMVDALPAYTTVPSPQ